MRKTNRRPKISVIIPVYNADKYLQDCLDSILSQEIKDIQIICVDDGSTDRSREFLEKYASIDSRIIVLEQHNLGAGAARNRGLAVATGEYLYFPDADDILMPGSLAKCYTRMKLEKADVLVFSSNQLDVRTNKITFMPWSLNLSHCPDKKPFSPDDVSDYIFNAFGTWAWNKMFLHDFIEKNNLRFQEIRRTNDFEFVFCALALSSKISIIQEPQYIYRVGTGTSLQDTNSKAPLEFLKAYKETKKKLVKYGLYSKFECSYLNAILGGSFYNLRSVKGQKAHAMILNFLKFHADGIFHFSDLLESKCYYKQQLDTFRNINRYSEAKEKMLISQNLKVSIIVPCLNSIDFLYNCIESIIDQTLVDIEIICVDAGSTDGTLETLQEYAAIDHRIHIMHSPKKSYGYQMNLGFQAARGEYIGIVESDDYVEPEMFEKLYNLAQTDNLDLAKSGFFNHYSKPVVKDIPSHIPANAPKGVFCPLESQFTETAQFFGMSPSIWTGLYRAEFIRAKNIKFTETPGASYQDTAFTFKVWCCAERAEFIDECLLHYRRDNDNSSSNSRGKVYCVVDEYQEEERFLSDEQPEIKDRAEGIRCRLKYGAYLWNYRRLVMPEKLEFLKYAAKEFADDMESGYFIQKYFSEYQWNELKSIIRDYRAFDIVSCNGNKWKPEDRISVMRFISLFNEKQDCLNGEREFHLVKPNAVDSPLVSVVIPVYNSREFIMDCVNSIREQSLKEIEIICVDDGSTDDSLHALLQLAFVDERISVYTERNCGQGVARNNAAHMAKGKYLYFMDSDDLLAPETLEELFQRMTADGLDVIYFDADSFGSQDADLQKLDWYKKYYHRVHQYNGIYSGLELMSLMQGNNEYRVSPVLQMLKADFYRESQLLFPEGIIHEDNVFTFKSMFLATRAGYMNKSYYRRRVRRDSTMTRCLSWNNAYGYFKCFLIMLDFLKGQDANILPKEIYEILAGVYRNGRNAYSAIPWVERQTQFALPELERALIKLYYEEWVAISWKLELEKRKDIVAKSDISRASYDHLLYDFTCMQNSISFRIGRKITWAPRKIRNVGRCFKQHGIVYTMKRIVEHFGIDMGTGDFKK